MVSGNLRFSCYCRIHHLYGITTELKPGNSIRKIPVGGMMQLLIGIYSAGIQFLVNNNSVLPCIDAPDGDINCNSQNIRTGR
jgi:hypothetical protein